MDVIRSSQNAIFKSLRRLIEHGRERRAQRMIVLEGVHLVQSLQRCGGEILQYIVREDKADDAEILHWTQGQHQLFSHARLADLSQLDHPPTLLALARLPQPEQRSSKHAILLDRIQDPGNLGTLLRSAAAAGIAEVHLCPGCTDAWSLRCLRAGMGAHFQLTLQTLPDLDQIVVAPRQMAVTCLNNAQPLYQADLRTPTLWVFGNEGEGVSGELLARADLRLRIDMAAGMESLNVTAAATVCLFEQRRQEGSLSSTAAND